MKIRSAAKLATGIHQFDKYTSVNFRRQKDLSVFHSITFSIHAEQVASAQQPAW